MRLILVAGLASLPCIAACGPSASAPKAPTTTTTAASTPTKKNEVPPTAKACLDLNSTPEDRSSPCTDACNERHAPSCLAYAKLTEDEGMKIRGLDRACQSDDSEGCKKRDVLLAKMKAACRKDAPDACFAYGGALLQLDKLTEKDMAAVSDAFEIACEAKNEACVRLGQMHEDSPPKAEHLKDAQKFYRKACDRNDPYGCCKLFFALTDPVEKKSVRAKAAALKSWCTEPGPNGTISAPPSPP